MATYIVEASEKENKNTDNKHSILTQNRLQTIDKREVSLEQISQVDEEKDILNNYINSLDIKKQESKNKLLCHKISITGKDLQNKYIKQIEECISQLKNKINTPNYAFKNDISKIKAIIIDLKKDEYLIKSCINKTITFNKLNFTKKGEINYYQSTGYNENDNYKFINDSSFYFHKPEHIAALIQNYNSLKEYSINEVQSTIYWILIDFENLIEYAFQDCKYEKYKDVLKYKLQGYTNEEINNALISTYDKGYSTMYISSLINRILPNLLAEKYQEYIYEWIHLYKIKGKWKQCSKCGQIKLASKYNFSLNKKGKYGFHSICKKCRQKRGENK